MTGATERLSAALADRYRIERPLGQGGMATVYLAEDLKHKRRVAVKVLKPELAAVLGAERFVQEITTTASLSHPHILPLFDSGSADGFLFYVMPFVEGETLRDKLNRETQLGVDEAVRIATEVADALDYAHRHGVIHRDIKPENILLHDGRPMVADFGIALAVSAAAGGRMTETGLSLGTPHYMSPEQATAEKEITARSDVYSLASVLYEMLAGQPPHLGGSAQQIIMKIIAEPVEPVTRYRKAVPPHVAAALGKALEKLPADRFESARAFATALANPAFTWRGAGGTSNGGVAGGAGGSRAAGLGWRAVAGIAVVALGAGVGIAKVAATAPPAEGTRRVMLGFAPNEEPPGQAVAVPSSLALAPDERGLLYVGPGITTRTQFWFRPWNALGGRRLPPVADDACCAAFSPTGDSIAYLSPPHLLTVLPLVGGVPLVVGDSGIASVTDIGGGVDWGPDGMIYASGTVGTGIVRVSPSGGSLERLSSVDTLRGDGWHVWPHVLPDARGVLVTILSRRDPFNPERSTIGVLDLSSRRVEVLVQGVRATYAPTGHLVVAKASGVLVAVPFDVATMRVSGRERELADTAAVEFNTAYLALTGSGTLAYSKRTITGFTATWVDRSGRWEPIAADLTGTLLDTPRLSADESELLLGIQLRDGRENIWLKSLRTGSLRRLTFDGVTNSRPAWRPGTRSVTFTSDRDAVGFPTNLYERTGSGSGPLVPVRTGEARGLGAHSWSPDGKWLLLRTDDQTAGNADILGIRPGVDTVPTAFVATAAEELSPAVSHDGRWLAYSSNESGRREIYVRPFPGQAETHYLVSSAGGSAPVWSHDGKELFFIDGAGMFMSVPILDGSTFQTAPPRALFNASRFLSNPFTPMYDVTADGKRFVMLRSESDSQVRVVVVFNFLEELRRLMREP